ncbi:MAG TPA: glycosyltransferase family 1 protein [Planctomycetaceae bacterium]|nr:glycosyltransferase family 1 protein [Planctomycetaceae bacterium]
MRILVVASFAESLVRFRLDLLILLRGRGVEVHAAAPNISSDVRQTLEDESVVVHELPLDRNGSNPLRDFGYCGKLCSLVRNTRPDILFCYTLKPVIYGGIAGRFCGVPRVVSMLTGLGSAFSSSERLLVQSTRLVARQILKRSLRYADEVIVQNPDDKKFLLASRYVNQRNVQLVNGSGINLEFFKKRPLPNSFAALMISRLIEEKGVREFAGAAKIVREKYPSARFILVGWPDGADNSISQEEIEAWCGQGLIDFRGRLADVRSVLAEASVVVLPSYYPEGTPRTLLEALATGRAVVTCDMPGCRETVVENENGFLVAPKSAEEVGRSIVKLAENSILLEDMANKSRELAESKFDVKDINEQMFKILLDAE